MKTRKLLSMLLAIVMVVGMLPGTMLTAFAAEDVITVTEPTLPEQYTIDSLKTLAPLQTPVDSSTIPSAIEYDLWVGGEQFTSEMLTVSDGNGGTATYDPQTNTLTLNYINITAGYIDDQERVIGIYADGDLNIELAGENDITMPDDDNRSYGIRAKGNLSISGSGSLNAIAGNVTAQDSEDHYSTGIHTSGQLNIFGATVYAKGGDISAEGESYSRGVYSEGGLQVDFGGSLTAEGGRASGSMAYSSGLEALGYEEYLNISIYDGNMIAIGGDTEGVIVAESNGAYLELAGFYVYENTANVELTCGNAKATSDDESNKPYACSNGITVYEGDIAIHGGTVEITGGTWEGIDGDGWAAYVASEEGEDGVVTGGNVLVEWETIERSPSGYGFIGPKVTITSTDEEKGAILAENVLEIGDKLIISEPEGGKTTIIEEENYSFDTILDADDSLAKKVVIAPLIYSVKIENADYGMSVLVPNNTSINEAYKDMLEDAGITDFSGAINTEKSGYIFDGFYTESGEKFDFNDSVISDMTITARWTKKSYGGGISSTTTTTTKNDDGSTTKTTTNKRTGTVTEITTNPDGSSTTVETKKDGTKVTTETNADGEIKTEIDLSKDKETEVTIPVPDADYVTSIIVTDKDGKETEITDFEITEDGVKISIYSDCTVVLVGGDAYITPSKKVFQDVHPAGHWSAADVDYVFAKGLMNGVTETNFAPNDKLTRAMLVTVFYRLEGEPGANKSIPFADVDMGSYYANAVIWEQQNGIVNGVSDTEFAPDSNITREQIASIIYRYATFKNYDTSQSGMELREYDDCEAISSWATEAMQWAVNAKLITGKTETTVNPHDNATRAEVAAILHRFIESNK